MQHVRKRIKGTLARDLRLPVSPARLTGKFSGSIGLRPKLIQCHPWVELLRSDRDMLPGKAMTARNLGQAVGALMFLFAPWIGHAQVGPAMRIPLSVHLFGTSTAGISSGPNANNTGSLGYSLGGFIQTPHVFGAEVRGSYLRWGSDQQRFDALGGFRAARHYSRFSPYGVVLAGIGHPIIRTNGPKSPQESNDGFEWKLGGGVDLYSGRHWSLRAGEVSYSIVYALPGRSISSFDFSGGIVYHIPVMRER